MPSVSVNPPKTPVTKGSNSIAAATVPNVCKMPGPPAPFVPTPLPNIGRSALSPNGYSKKVKIEGNAVAIKGASFASQGDIASKGTGGGIVSSNTHGPTKFVGPGSLDVKVEGKNVHFLGDPMLNNCGPSGSPANAATLMGVSHLSLPEVKVDEVRKLLCEDLCNHENEVKKGKHRRSSNDLEKKCQRSRKYGKNVQFRTRFPNGPGDWTTKYTKPDAIIPSQNPPPPAKKCFDFKLCGDRSRGDQVPRQRAISQRNAKVEIISCEKCKSCKHKCDCSKG